VVHFWYRQSPQGYFPNPRWGSISIPAVGHRNPFPAQTGEVTVALDTEGRLLEFLSVPKGYMEDPLSPAEQPDWSSLLELAGLDEGALTPVEPRLQPFSAPDQRAAWVGTMPGQPDLEIRVEAGMLRGRPVQFTIAWPWELERLGADPVRRSAFGLATTVGMIVLLALLAVAAVLARRNIRRGRADRRGALRLAVAVFALVAVWELLRTHSGLYGNPVLVVFVLASALFTCAFIGTMYLALEPYARRIWPYVMV
jgi:hypothetical protein